MSLIKTAVFAFLATGILCGKSVVADTSGLIFTQSVQFLDVPAADELYLNTNVSVSGDSALVGRYPGFANIYRRNSAGVWDFEASLLPDVELANGYFSGGRPLALSGDTAIFGSERETFIFRRTPVGAWIEEARLPYGKEGNFNLSVALDEDTALIGRGGSGDRSVIVFKRNQNAEWLVEAELTIEQVTRFNPYEFAGTLAIKGDTVVVGRYNDWSSAEPVFNVYIYRRSADGNWRKEANIETSLADHGSAFYDESPVAISKDLVAVAHGDSGVRIFRRNNEGSWQSEGLVVSYDGEHGDRFGESIAIDGKYLLVGAPSDRINVQSGPYGPNPADAIGSAYLFVHNLTDGKWYQEAKLTAAELAPERFGHSVSIDSNYAIVGSIQSVYAFDLSQVADKDADGLRNSLDNCPERSNTNQSDSDSDGLGDNCDSNPNTPLVLAEQVAQECDANNPTPFSSAYQQQSVQQLANRNSLSNNPLAFDNLHQSIVSIDGDTAVVSVDLENKVAVYKLSASGEWLQQATIEIHDERFDRFGSLLAISGDVIVVGTRSDIELTEQVGADTGAVYIYRRQNDETWQQETKLIIGDLQDGDTLVRSIAIDGDTLIVGSSGFNQDGNETGAAYIFRRSVSGDWLQEAKLNIRSRLSVQERLLRVLNLDAADAVAIKGNYAIVGSSHGGLVYVRTDDGQWLAQAVLDGGALARYYEKYLHDVWIGCGYARVGASVYRYESGGQWSQELTFASEESVILAVSEEWILTGTSSQSPQEQFKIFTHSRQAGGSWVVVGTLDPGDPRLFALTLYDLAVTASISNDLAMIGAGSSESVFVVDLASIQGRFENFPTGDTTSFAVCRDLAGEADNRFGWQDGASCRYQPDLLTVDDVDRMQYLRASNPLFPQSDELVAFSGSSAVVTERIAADETISTLYTTEDQMNWVGQADINIHNASSAIDGNTAVFGVSTANLECESLIDGRCVEAEFFDWNVDTYPWGGAFVYQRDGSGQWKPQAKLLEQRSENSAYFTGFYGNGFGAAVAVSGDTIAVSAVPLGERGGEPGRISMFRRDLEGNWISEGILASGFEDPDGFGTNFALSGDTLVVGTVAAEVCCYLRVPVARVYARDALNQWKFQAVLRADGLKAHGNGTEPQVSIFENTVLLHTAEKTVMFNRGATDHWRLVATFAGDNLKIAHNRLWQSTGVNSSGGVNYVPVEFSALSENSVTDPIIVIGDQNLTPVENDEPGSNNGDVADGVSGDGNTGNNISASENCNYQDADANSGWGWDPVAQLSCFPRCIDSDGDGYGWDGVNSCRPVYQMQCIDSDGDGYGWNGAETCTP